MNRAARQFLFGTGDWPDLFPKDQVDALVHPEDREELQYTTTAVLRDGHARNWNLRMAAPDGGFYTAVGRMAPAKCPAPCPSYDSSCGRVVLLTSMDRTERSTSATAP